MPSLPPAVERAPAPSDEPTTADTQPLRRINDVAEEVGLTTRAIRYYEEQGLLTPSARSSGAYRLYDATDIDRLRSIKAFRDDAGFSLAEIATLLDDESERQRSKAAFLATADEARRRQILIDAIARLDRQLQLLDSKIERLTAMRDDVAERARRGRDRLVEMDKSS